MTAPLSVNTLDQLAVGADVWAWSRGFWRHSRVLELSRSLGLVHHVTIAYRLRMGGRLIRQSVRPAVLRLAKPIARRVVNVPAPFFTEGANE